MFQGVPYFINSSSLFSFFPPSHYTTSVFCSTTARHGPKPGHLQGDSLQQPWLLRGSSPGRHASPVRLRPGLPGRVLRRHNPRGPERTADRQRAGHHRGAGDPRFCHR